MNLHKHEVDLIADEYFQTPLLKDDVSYKESLFMEYDIFFDKKFDELYEDFLVFNNAELKKFIKSNDDLLLLIDKIYPLLNKYFPDFVFILDFNQDPEFESLNQVEIFIHIAESGYDENWNKLKLLNNEIDGLNEFPYSIKRLISVDLW